MLKRTIPNVKVYRTRINNAKKIYVFLQDKKIWLLHLAFLNKGRFFIEKTTSRVGFVGYLTVTAIIKQCASNTDYITLYSIVWIWLKNLFLNLSWIDSAFGKLLCVSFMISKQIFILTRAGRAPLLSVAIGDKETTNGSVTRQKYYKYFPIWV